MEKYREFCSFTGEWNQESIEANDWADLLDALEEYQIKSQEECRLLKEKFLKIVKESAISEVYVEIERRIQKRGYTDQELEHIIGRLSNGRVWDEERFVYDPVKSVVWDMANGNKQLMNPAILWWDFISAITDLQILLKNNRIKAV